MCFAVFLSFMLFLLGLLWAMTSIYSGFKPDFRSPSALHWAVGIIAPLIIALYGLRKKSLDRSGAAAGLIVGFLLSVSSFNFMASLLSFFIFASKATKFRSSKKKKLEAEFKEGGQRNWIQVICNGGPAALLAIFYMWEVGCVNLPFNFLSTYSASWYSVAVMSAIACASGDTFASEIGTVVGNLDPVHIITLRRVPRGTNGGVSLVGTLSSMFGGAVVGIPCYFTVLLTSQWTVLKDSPPQWPILLYAVLAGLMGSLIDSILGATLQFSGRHKTLGCIVESKGPNIEHISGFEILDNHSVNLLASLLTGIIMPYIAAETWNWFV
ncbi:transmembrane protein 19 [Aplysia californica]|uniref:Transmembrane protein 19 n=1 Tax=Aplysia californica TaxID=6500 RepID=A0ABM0JZJ7_APLCA|nr:transmembrane protein 19 [Aplysia californica]